MKKQARKTPAKKAVKTPAAPKSRAPNLSRASTDALLAEARRRGLLADQHAEAKRGLLADNIRVDLVPDLSQRDAGEFEHPTTGAARRALREADVTRADAICDRFIRRVEEGIDRYRAATERDAVLEQRKAMLDKEADCTAAAQNWASIGRNTVEAALPPLHGDLDLLSRRLGWLAESLGSLEQRLFDGGVLDDNLKVTLPEFVPGATGTAMQVRVQGYADHVGHMANRIDALLQRLVV